MNARTERPSLLERMAPLTGVVAVVLSVTAFAIYTGPEFVTDSARDIALSISDNSGKALAAGWIDMLGGGFALLFAAVLRSWLLEHEGGTGRFSNLAFGAFVAATVCFWIYDSTLIALAARADEDGAVLSVPSAATAFDVAGMIAFVGGAMALAVAFAAVAVVGFRHAAMPVWLAWSTAVLALVCVVPLTNWLGVIIGGLWLLVTSVWLYRALQPAPTPVSPGQPQAPLGT
jgi:hypothetical protein